MIKLFSTLFAIAFYSISLWAQTAPFNVYLEPVNINGLGGGYNHMPLANTMENGLL